MKKQILCFCLTISCCFAEEVKPTQELVVESSFQQTIFDETVDYRVSFGNLVLKDGEGKEKASIYFTAYFKKGENQKERPLTFCFNGGPGGGSVWLNLGGFGPKCLPAGDLEYQNPPYSLVDNPYSLLSSSDLVFVDPVSTGMSKESPGVDVKTLLKLDEDIKMMADFVRLFTIKNKRWDSPKYLMGESYGGMRVVKMGYLLHENYGFYLNGLLLISPFLDYSTVFSDGLNDLPSALYVPAMAAVSHFQKALPQELQQKELMEVVTAAREFSETEYPLALLKGTALTPSKKAEVVQKLSSFLGIQPGLIEAEDLRISPSMYRKVLLAHKNLLVGRFDGRSVGVDSKAHPFFASYDPSLDAVFGAMTAAYNQFLIKDLKWPEAKEYFPLVTLPSWDWGKESEVPTAVFELQKLASQNPQLKIFVTTGLFDLAIPYTSTEYCLSHLYLPGIQSRIVYKRFDGGHMMYLNPEIRKELGVELKKFFDNR